MNVQTRKMDYCKYASLSGHDIPVNRVRFTKNKLLDSISSKCNAPVKVSTSVDSCCFCSSISRETLHPKSCYASVCSHDHNVVSFLGPFRINKTIYSPIHQNNF